MFMYTFLLSFSLLLNLSLVCNFEIEDSVKFYPVKSKDKQCILSRFQVNHGKCQVNKECNRVRCVGADPIFGWNNQELDFQFKCLNNGIIISYHSVSTPVTVNSTVIELLQDEPEPVVSSLSLKTENRNTSIKYSRDFNAERNIYSVNKQNDAKLDKNSSNNNTRRNINGNIDKPFPTFYATIDRTFDELCTGFYEYRSIKKILIGDEPLFNLKRNNRIMNFFPKTILQYVDNNSGESLLPKNLKPQLNKTQTLSSKILPLKPNVTNELTNKTSFRQTDIAFVQPANLNFEAVVKSPLFFPVAIVVSIMVILILFVFMINILIYKQVRKTPNMTSYI